MGREGRSSDPPGRGHSGAAMKLTVKTLYGTNFEIRVQHSDTIMAVKKKIEEIQGKDSYPWGEQLLIHNGKVLKDKSTLDENEVSKVGFLVVMLSKSKASASSGTSSAQPSSTPVTSQAPPVAQPQAPQPLVPATTTSQPERLSAEPGRGHRGAAMKLTVKTLKGTHFEIRVQHSDTIMAVKKKIEEIQGKDSYPWGEQLLIHNGKVLKDKSTLDENEVSKVGFLVVLLSKSKTSASSGTSSAQPSSNPVTSQAPPVAQPQAPQPLTPSSIVDHATSDLLSGSNVETMINQIMEMGGGSWDKDKVQRALRAAYNNPERATDYVYSMKKWYVVFKGRVPRVYTDWSECHAQVDKFKGNSYISFQTRQEAETNYLKFLEGERRNTGEQKNFIIIVLLIVIAFLLYLVIV